MNCRTRALGLMLGLLFLTSATAFAVVPVRKGSQNGTNDSQPRMNLLGPTQPGAKDGGDVGVATQVICPNQDVAGAFEFDTNVFDPADPNTLKRSGHCVSGIHKFLFQIQPGKIFGTLTITLSGLVGFVPGTDPNVSVNNPTYGVQICDDGGNTLELCTNLAQANLPVINAAINAKNNKVIFTISNIGPTTVPQGPDYEGAGLTFFVVLQQNSETPIAAPKIGVN
jgi:hypothetical protein